MPDTTNAITAHKLVQSTKRGIRNGIVVCISAIVERCIQLNPKADIDDLVIEVVYEVLEFLDIPASSDTHDAILTLVRKQVDLRLEHNNAK